MAAHRSRKCPNKSSYKFIVSACLLGINCTYNDNNKFKRHIMQMAKKGLCIPLCPELLGSMSVPRERCEISGGDGEKVLVGKARVITISGRDISANLIDGARKTLAIAKTLGIKRAILKSNSPSCGRGMIYDGTFSGILTKGNGITAAHLLAHGIKVYNEKDVSLWTAKSIT